MLPPGVPLLVVRCLTAAVATEVVRRLVPCSRGPFPSHPRPLPAVGDHITAPLLPICRRPDEEAKQAGERCREDSDQDVRIPLVDQRVNDGEEIDYEDDAQSEDKSHPQPASCKRRGRRNRGPERGYSCRPRRSPSGYSCLDLGGVILHLTQRMLDTFPNVWLIPVCHGRMRIGAESWERGNARASVDSHPDGGPDRVGAAPARLR